MVPKWAGSWGRVGNAQPGGARWVFGFSAKLTLAAGTYATTNEIAAPCR
jgi:hypothetical protein